MTPKDVKMTPKEFQKYLARDGGCLHCGAVETAVPNHRINRGMGGSGKKSKRHEPSNIATLCSDMNYQIEHSAHWANLARMYGWKLLSWQDPETCRVYDMVNGVWYLLDNNYGRSKVV